MFFSSFIFFNVATKVQFFFKTENFSPTPSLYLTYTYPIPTVYLPLTHPKSIKNYKNEYLQKNILQKPKKLVFLHSSNSLNTNH